MIQPSLTLSAYASSVAAFTFTGFSSDDIFILRSARGSAASPNNGPNNKDGGREIDQRMQRIEQRH
eukprot:CAMPEP_0172329116 /NCGR_PEP_ID=MMETSP1058-20130122/60714_1 /TAXON_ID=83371 /ORGANISM="Detonula confervacea, Strain CCMP 353" /LENGTH=65 /DNA_ID=CAMNT_0013046271 /DNA_START=35 /DNA_END=233 /DNA_ORIENTATION=-